MYAHIFRFRLPSLFAVTLTLASLATPSDSHAQSISTEAARCNSYSSTTRILELPANITVPRDIAPGQTVALTGWITVDEPNRADCQFTGQVPAAQQPRSAAAGYAIRMALPAPLRDYTENGITYSLYPLSGAPGVGAIFSFRQRNRAIAGSGCNDAFPTVTQHSQFVEYRSMCSGNISSFFLVGATVRVKLIKYDAITDGTRINSTLIFEGFTTTVRGQAGSPVVRGNPNLNVLLGATTINVLTCSPRDVEVNMGRVARSDFNGINGPLRPVPIRLDCPAGINTVHIRVEPNTPEIGNQSIVALDSRSSATGVGVQLLLRSGANLPFRTDLRVNQHQAGQAGSIEIPFQARYVQTGGAISPGTANTTMTFTLTYR